MVFFQRVVHECFIQGAHIELSQHAPVLTIMLTAVIPLVVEKCPLFVITLSPHVIRILVSVSVVVAVARGHEVIRRQLVEILEDGSHECAYVVGRSDGFAIEMTLGHRRIRSLWI